MDYNNLSDNELINIILDCIDKDNLKFFKELESHKKVKDLILIDKNVIIKKEESNEKFKNKYELSFYYNSFFEIAYKKNATNIFFYFINKLNYDFQTIFDFYITYNTRFNYIKDKFFLLKLKQINNLKIQVKDIEGAQLIQNKNESELFLNYILKTNNEKLFRCSSFTKTNILL